MDNEAASDTGNHLETEAGSLDIEAAADSIGAGLFNGGEAIQQEGTGHETTQTDTHPADQTQTTAESDAISADPATAHEAAVTVRPAPKSWAKDTHEAWAKIDPKAQDYIEKREKDFLDGLEQYKGDATFARTVREAINPFRPMLGLRQEQDVPVIQRLLTAQYRLTNGTEHERQTAAVELLTGLNMTDLLREGLATSPSMDPKFKALEDEISRIKSGLTAQRDVVLAESRAKTSKEVDAFASDPAHAYFDDVADDIIVYVHAGASLQDAYEKAVWANPVTRAKEQARLAKEQHAVLIEKGKKDAAAAKQATSANIRSRDTKRAPTEPSGSMEETMRETLQDINSRTH